ncbi:MAG: YggS family pyridoxal phosphate-dependent enzyme [Pseudomonadota bacterium]|nr:YggS family pyridoxal phosphate-dependent enzyme [Pseudomonadota bacterium]
MSSDLLQRYQTVLQRIQTASQSSNRIPGSVSLLAVSKTKPVEDITELAKQGQIAFGENYLQEALQKIEVHPELEWHFIGPIQSNKTKPIAENFAWVHSVDRLKIAQRLSNQRPDTLPPLNILLEVNISGEASKAGFSSEELLKAAKEISNLPNLNLRGLMAIPQSETDHEKQRLPFAKMKQLLNQLQQTLPDCQLDTLSMGMSGDLEAAIEEGATIVRIGTDIFGARNYAK